MMAQDRITARFSTYPDTTGKRQAEGGRRLKGHRPTGTPAAPLVTIITVCWNSEKTLEQAIRSALAQTYENIEYVIVDGGSTDGTLDIIRTHEDRIDYYLSEPDGGIYYAMNKGLELSQGDYIVFLNSDDWYAPETIEKLVAFQAESQCDFVSALANYVDEDGTFVRVQPPSPFDAGVDFRMPLRHETMLIPARVYDEAGPYDTGYRIIADRIFTAGLFWRGYSHELLEEPLLNFRMSGTSSVDLDKLFAERERALTSQYPGMSTAAMDDLINLETISLERLCEISRGYRAPRFRTAATAYALDREAQGHAQWQDVDTNAFSPALKKRAMRNSNSARRRQARARMPQPAVSVILPFYNAEDTLRDCLDSFLAQTLTDFEVICVNDQTPDQSQKIVDEYRSRDPRIKCYINEINVGLGSTRNRGIALAQGEYIFHIDPDDVIPPTALEALVAHAQKHGSDMVRGAFVHEQLLMGQQSEAVRKGLPEGAEPIINTTLAASPDLLKSTEGHWSYLYRTEFAKRVFYPEDLKMGQDSIFLVHALTTARSISVIPEVIYHYRANTNSAMNVFNFRKYIDEIEWRYRAWKVLCSHGQCELGAHLLFNYWNIPFFKTLDGQFNAQQKRRFFRKLFYAFATAGNADLSQTTNPALRQTLQAGLNHFARLPAPEAQPEITPLRIEALTSSDHGGAGLASLRSVQGLRTSGHTARLLSLFTRSEAPYVWQLQVTEQCHAAAMDDTQMRDAWRHQAVLTHREEPGLRARELFSKTGNVADPDVLGGVFAEADVVHLHWVSGVVDYDRLPDMVGKKPVAWTLHDMNPFTGGCHYSEGCTEYKNACKACPLVNGATNLPHKAWKKKKQAYSQIPNLQIICPSEQLAQFARESSLFGDRPVHVIPNIFPIADFQPTNKSIARQKLGLPLNRKYIVFGADSLNNSRKGGDLLQAGIEKLTSEAHSEGIEGLFFGQGSLDLGIKTVNMGYVQDPAKLSLIYAAADVFAFPSREDNAPQTVAEAMLSGTPVVGFRVGTVPELIEHKKTGYIARYADAEDFAKGLIWALNDAGKPEALLRGLRAHLTARAHSDPEMVVGRHLKLYREMIQQSVAAPGTL